jgi:hypothetical protein
MSLPTSLRIALLGAFATACSSSQHTSTFDATPGPLTKDAGSGQTLPGTGTDGGLGDGGTGTGVATPTGPVKDFPAPIFDGTAPANAATLFGSTTQGAAAGGPCIVEPENDVLYPQDWLRPRFRWNAAAGENLFEMRLHVKNQIDDLVVYTTNTSWTMPLAMWNALRMDSPTLPMTLTIRAGVLSGGALTGESFGSATSMEIAPVQATGAIVYWTTAGGTALKGFTVGDESVEQVLVPAQVTAETTTCIGCHTAAPDGEYVGLSYQGTGWSNGMALIAPDAGTVGTPPSFLGAGAATALARYDLGISSFSRAHWTAGDRREVVAYDDNGGTTAALQWIDIEATTAAAATGTIARNGDSSSAGAPSWSHDGNTIAYVSTSHFCDGRLGAGCDGVTYNAVSDPGSTADLYTVPYTGGAGGAAKPVPGASDPSVQEYYPVFSPDDAWLAFVRAPNGVNMYDQPAAEVSVIPAAGGTATRLLANDPPACAGTTSPGITNSWPKWGPVAQQANGSTYYWLVFSSTRSPGGLPQLFITSVVVTGKKVATHGAIYLWNQPATEGNHTPAWDTFKVPPAGGIPK